MQAAGSDAKRGFDRAETAAGKRGSFLSVLGDVYTILTHGEDTGGQYALVEMLVAPGNRPPPHGHSREDEGFYVLDGELKNAASG